MKKLTNYMLSMLAIAGMLFLSSCGDDEDDPTPGAKGPSVFLVSTDSTISDDATLTAGSSFGIIVNATKGDANMDTWKITRDGSDLSGFEGDAPENDNFTVPIADIPVSANSGTYEYTFEVTDKDGVTGSVSWTITVEDAATFTSIDNKTLGGQSNATLGSFYNSDGSIYLSSAANANPENVDFFYYVGSTNGPTLWSPTDADAVGDDIFGITSWSTRNDTKIGVSTLTYADATVADVVGATITGTKANIDVGTVVIFETAGGVRGILEITSLAAGNDGSVTFNSKIVE